MSVKMRRAVSKSSVELAVEALHQESAASLCSPRRPMSIASICAGEAERMAL